MTLLEELKIFIKTILNWVYIFISFSFFFFLFGFKDVLVFGRKLLLPMPTQNSFSAQFFNMVRRDLLPQGVDLITTNPMSAFVSQILFSMLLSFFITSPLFLYRIIVYLRPALSPQERKAVMLSLFPIVGLFLAGALFSYLFLIPMTFKVLYPYAQAIGVTPFFSLDEFIHYVVSLMLVVGLMFLLPVFMALLSLIGVVPPSFWKNKWRVACFFFLILSAIITPDGTGITMIMLFLPLVALYFAGYFFAKKLGK